MQEDGFVIVGNNVWTDLAISDGALRLWIAIASHCIGKDRCWPSQERLALMIGKQERQVRSLLKELESKGHISVIRVSGQSRGYELERPGNPLPTPGNLMPTPGKELPPTRQFNVREPGNFMSDTRQSTATELDIRSTTKEEDKNIYTPIKKSRKKSEKKPPVTREDLEEQLRKIEGNINLYIEAFPTKNVRETLDALRDYVLIGDGKGGGPNRNGYRDLNLTFRNWLRNAKYVPTWVAAQANNTPAKLPDKLPEPKEHKPYRPSEDPELLESLTDIAEKRAAKMKAREAEDKKRKELIIKELEEEVRLKEREKKPEPVVEKVTPPSRAMTKEEIIAEMKRIANG